MHYRFASLTALALFFAAVAQASAQGPVRERVAVFEEVVIYVANRFDVRLDQVLVDTVRSGRSLSGRPGKPHNQRIEVQEMRDAAQRLGFRLGAPSGIAACFTPPGVADVPCELEETGVGLLVHAPDIAGDRATVTFVYFFRHPTITNQRALMRAQLLWRGGAWQVTEAILEGRVRSRPGDEA